MAAGGYDISASRSEAIAQAANLTTPTIINFGDKGYVDGGWYGQTTEQAPTSVAARNAGDTAGKTSGTGLPVQAGGPNWLLIGGGALVLLAVVAMVHAAQKKS